MREGESFKTGSSEKRERMAVYIDWLLTPANEREPTTKKGLAELLGVTPETLRRYHSDPWLQRELADRARKEARVDRLPDILQSMYDQAINRENTRSVAAAKVYLDFLNQTEEARTIENLEELSNDDLMKVMNELLARQAKGDTDD